MSSMCTAAVEAAIKRTIPPHIGRRERCIFKLCRELQAIPECANADPWDLEFIVRWWYELAEPNIGTKEYAATLAAFIRAWDRVKIPKGETAVQVAFRQALVSTEPLPDVLVNDNLRILAAVCRELQKMAGSKPFYLDCRGAGDLFGVTYKAAWKWLDSLCTLKIIQKVSSGSLKTGKANEYRYLAKD